LPQSAASAEKYILIVRALSVPNTTHPAPSSVRATSLVSTEIQKVQFKIEYHCPTGYQLFTPTEWPSYFPALASMPVPHKECHF
jgi:hypothetical protein